MRAFKELWDYRQMLFSLVKKELTTRYKGSVLGFLWTFINPLLQLVIYSVVFSQILMRGSQIENYSMYLFVALVPWLFCSTSLVSGSNCILSSAGLVQKIYFPRIILPITSVVSNFMNMVFSFIIVFAALLISGIGLSVYAFWLPVIMILEFFFVLGLVFIFSALTVYFRDLEHILGIVTMAWFYITPILYTLDMVPVRFMPLAMANPMTGIVSAYRDILYYKQAPNLQPLLITLLVSVVALVLGYVIFHKLQKRFAEEL